MPPRNNSQNNTTNSNINDELRFINIKLDDFSGKMAETSKNIEKIKDALYHPDDGLYKRISVGDENIRKIDRWINENEKNNTVLRDSCETISTAMTPLIDDFKIRMGRKKWTDKILWTIIAIVLGIMVPTAWKVLIVIPSQNIPQTVDTSTNSK